MPRIWRAVRAEADVRLKINEEARPRFLLMERALSTVDIVHLTLRPRGRTLKVVARIRRWSTPESTTIDVPAGCLPARR